MSSVIHIAEVAVLLAVAYVLGWAIGYIARRIASRQTAAQPTIPAERIAAVTGAADADALVKAPVIAPVPTDPPPATPQPEPVATVAEPVAIPATTEPELAPVEPVAPPLSAITIPQVVEPPPFLPEPRLAEPAVEPVLVLPEPVPAPVAPPAASEPEPAPAPVEAVASPEPQPVIAAAPVLEPQPEPVAPLVAAAPAPEPEPEPVVPFTATPAAKPGEAWSGEIKGRAAEPFERTVATVEPEAEPVIERAAVPEPVAVEPASTPAPEPVVVPPPPPREYDEDEAMRAIEGGWSRVKARAMPDAPELHDLGAAVAAAQTAVEQVLAKAGIDPVDKFHTGKPKGLIRARSGGKDDLKRINGLGGLDESTLNNLGFFHFDQIAGWNEAEVLWMEAHVFARGRIGRENWQAQARALAATVSS